MTQSLKQRREQLTAKFNVAAKKLSARAHQACYGRYGALARPAYNFGCFAADDLRKSREQNIIYGILLCVPGGWFALSVIFATKYFSHRIIKRNPPIISRADVRATKYPATKIYDHPPAPQSAANQNDQKTTTAKARVPK